MRTIKYEEIVNTLKEKVIDINYSPSKHLLNLYDKGIESENRDISKNILKTLKDNSLIARDKKIPICQDTGTLVVFLYMGKDVSLDRGFINDAIYEGVEKGYQEGYLRKSIVKNPLDRVNTGNNLPPVIHTFLRDDDKLSLVIMAKGGGSENMSALKMLAPAEGIEGIKKFVIETVRNAGPNPCPPISVGLGIGSNFEGVALLAKKALVKDLIPDLVEDISYDSLEKELEEELNKLNIGPQGFGGKTSVFEVKVLMEPCHIASLPVGININCHVIRHERIDF